jgi:Peptidase A4 family
MLPVVAALGLAAVAAQAATAAEVSSNWAGYAVIAPAGGSVTFRDVTGTWVQPKVRCRSGRSDAVAFWVGLGGYADGAQSLEQLGTSAECDGSVAPPRYEAWWEILPAASIPIPLRIRAGDRVTAAVVVAGQTVTMSLKDVTRRTRFSKTVTVGQPLDVTSAEWIAEAPSDCSSPGNCRVVPLSNFGRVTFTNAAVIGNDHPGTISEGTWTPSSIELVTGGDNSGFLDTGGVLAGAVPGSVSADGRSFAVAWQRTVKPH